MSPQTAVTAVLGFLACMAVLGLAIEILRVCEERRRYRKGGRK